MTKNYKTLHMANKMQNYYFGLNMCFILKVFLTVFIIILAQMQLLYSDSILPDVASQRCFI